MFLIAASRISSLKRNFSKQYTVTLGHVSTDKSGKKIKSQHLPAKKPRLQEGMMNEEESDPPKTTEVQAPNVEEEDKDEDDEIEEKDEEAAKKKKILLIMEYDFYDKLIGTFSDYMIYE